MHTGERRIIAVGLMGLFGAIVGGCLLWAGIDAGRYFMYVSVPIGAGAIIYGRLSADIRCIREKFRNRMNSRTNTKSKQPWE